MSNTEPRHCKKCGKIHYISTLCPDCYAESLPPDTTKRGRMTKYSCFLCGKTIYRTCWRKNDPPCAECRVKIRKETEELIHKLHMEQKISPYTTKKRPKLICPDCGDFHCCGKRCYKCAMIHVNMNLDRSYLSNPETRKKMSESKKKMWATATERKQKLREHALGVVRIKGELKFSPWKVDHIEIPEIYDENDLENYFDDYDITDNF